MGRTLSSARERKRAHRWLSALHPSLLGHYRVLRKLLRAWLNCPGIFPQSDRVRTLLNPLDKDQILSRLKTIRPSSQRRWGLMTAHQMICHLRDGYKLYLGFIVVAPLGFPYPSRLLKWGSLWVPIPWPRGFKTLREIDQQNKGTPSSDFESDVAELRELINRFTSTTRDFRWPAHPYLGQMSAKEWMRLGYLHADHHLRQFGA